MQRPIFEGNFEIRQRGGARILAGIFPYGKAGVMSNRGRVRKESFKSRAFKFAIEDEPNRRIDLLIGHDFGKPVASRQAGSLVVNDTPDAVRFEATLPDADATPSWVLDVEKSIENGLMTGVSPGFVVPPLSVVRNAETLLDEPGNPGVQIRQINHAVLRELSIVTNPSYEDSLIELRSESEQDDEQLERLRTIWL